MAASRTGKRRDSTNPRLSHWRISVPSEVDSIVSLNGPFNCNWQRLIASASPHHLLIRQEEMALIRFIFWLTRISSRLCRLGGLALSSLKSLSYKFSRDQRVVCNGWVFLLFFSCFEARDFEANGLSTQGRIEWWSGLYRRDRCEICFQNSIKEFFPLKKSIYKKIKRMNLNIDGRARTRQVNTFL